MVAVGAMAMSSELRSPWVAMRSRTCCQRSGSVGSTPHRSNCRSPGCGAGVGERLVGARRLGELGRRPQRVEVDLLADALGRLAARGRVERDTRA